MLLSAKRVDALVGSIAVTYGMSDRKRRDGAREAVNAAARELELDPLAPPLPRFGAGEDVLRAAVRVLKLTEVDKQVERHRARVEAAEAAAVRLAELDGRRRELERVELGRMHDQIMAGNAPGTPPAEAIAELETIERELALVGLPDVRGWLPVEPAVVREAITAAMLPSVIFYGDLAVERLKVLTEDENYNSPAATTTQRAAQEVAGLVKSFNYRKEDEPLYRTLRAVHVAVELADLHRLHQRQALSIEQLEAASAG